MTENPSQELREMLQYMENSVIENVKNQELGLKGTKE